MISVYVVKCDTHCCGNKMESTKENGKRRLPENHEELKEYCIAETYENPIHPMYMRSKEDLAEWYSVPVARVEKALRKFSTIHPSSDAVGEKIFQAYTDPKHAMYKAKIKELSEHFKVSTDRVKEVLRLHSDQAGVKDYEMTIADEESSEEEEEEDEEDEEEKEEDEEDEEENEKYPTIWEEMMDKDYHW